MIALGFGFFLAGCQHQAGTAYYYDSYRYPHASPQTVVIEDYRYVPSSRYRRPVPVYHPMASVFHGRPVYHQPRPYSHPAYRRPAYGVEHGYPSQRYHRSSSRHSSSPSPSAATVSPVGGSPFQARPSAPSGNPFQARQRGSDQPPMTYRPPRPTSGEEPPATYQPPKPPSPNTLPQ